MLFSSIFSLACLTAVIATPLHPRQTTNTNVRINQIVDALDIAIHVNIPDVQNLEASHRANANTIGPQFDQLVTAYNTATRNLNATAISSGSNTTMPRNDDIGVTYATALSLTTSGLSGLSPTVVVGLPAMFAKLDPAIAASVVALNRTLPGSGSLIHTMMLDARQFLQRENMTQTLTVLGFPTA
ncbi:hypothetical protein E1B28_011557 [Marasmius oreades]|uniref:Uncharacterized protein n=1 Tax=Marasmius oreades TaxID=181124 RepID=A0A9P7RUH9_9AGAR|nr:uncharacterized protein E1B28_011557 [Marasmius oreades]KAG7089925.1 hypothetical protein E1B28_011557 [Marasmius oreades]